jgi:two-component system sensor histidine kinase UhpB
MKHRAKQLQGQCLIESAPGYGTVIRLTIPL